MANNVPDLSDALNCLSFSGSDVDCFLSSLICCHTHIPLRALVSRHFDADKNLLSDVPGNSPDLLVPFLLADSHWILLHISLKERSACWYDPLRNESPYLGEARFVCAKFIKTIDNDISLKDSESHEFPGQVNDYDCGPMICAYAVWISYPGSNIDMNPAHIRKIVHSLGNCTFSDGVGDGPGSTALLPFLSFSNHHVDAFAEASVNSKEFFVFPADLSRAIVANNRDFILEHFSLRDIVNKKKIAFPLFFRQCRWIVFLCDFSLSAISVWDPIGLQTMSTYDSFIHTLREFCKNFCMIDLQYVDSPPNIVTSQKYVDSGPLICGYMRNFSDFSFDNRINLKAIRTFATKFVLRSSGKSFKSAHPSTTSRCVAARTVLALSFLRDHSNDDLDQIYSAFSDHIYSIRPAKPRAPYLGCSEVSPNRLDHDKIQRTYVVNPKAAMAIIRPRVNASAKPTPADFTISVSQHNRPFTFCPDDFDCPINTGPAFSFRSPTSAEIVSCLRQKDKSSPGQSGISYQDILYSDPDGTICEKILSKILESNTVPSDWKTFDTLMIPKSGKEGEYHLPSSWRGIALQECLYKLLTTLLCWQLKAWIKSNMLLHPLQKSLGPSDGCAEHTFLLRAIIDHYVNSMKTHIHLAFMDIAAAFDTISVDYILFVLGQMGLLPSSIDLIRELYRDCHTRIICEGEATDRLSVTVGVRQGCPLSMLLFNIGIDPILNKLDSLICRDPVKIGNSTVSCMAYADDLVLFADNKYTLNYLVRTASKYVKAVGMEFRRSKCAYMDFPYNENNMVLLDSLPIPHLKADEGYVYLGSFISRLLRHTPEQVIAEVVADLELLKNSVLSPSQKLHAYQTFVHPKMVFYFRNTYIPFPDITAWKTGWEIVVRKEHKELLYLPLYASNSYIYTSKKHGGAGLTSVFDEYLVQSITHSFYLLNTPDSFVKDAVWTTLGYASKKYYSRNDILQWLNEGYCNSVCDRWWNKVQHAIFAFKTFGITIRFGNDFPSTCITIRLYNADYQISSTIRASEKDKVAEFLRKCLSLHYLHSWTEQKSAGRCASALSLSSYTTSVIYNSYLPNFEWEFIHKARSYTLPVSCRFKQTDLCRRCHESAETLMHVLCCCRPLMNYTNARHNTVVDILASEIREYCNAEVDVNMRCRFVHSALRVDLQVYFPEKKRIVLIDVKCPFDEKENLLRANTDNLEHYKSLAESIRRQYSDHKVSLFTFIVGALGTWIPDNYKALKAVFLTHREKAIANATIKSNIRWSTRHWIAFVDGRDSSNLSQFRGDPVHNPRAPAIEGPIFEDSDEDNTEVAVADSFQHLRSGER